MKYFATAFSRRQLALGVRLTRAALSGRGAQSKFLLASVFPILCLLPLTIARAAPPAMTPAEQAQAAEWVAAKFQGAITNLTPPAGLIVLANHDPVQFNVRGGRPLKIVNTQYTGGLYCHAVSKVAVRLPGPGKTLSAIVGVDSNEQTSGGRGNVVFAVRVNGREAFRSGVLHEGMAGVPISVPLDGASEFTLEVDDGGDGISCDQSDWADAKVALVSGQELWLGDLPLIGQSRQPCSTQAPFSFKYDGRPSAEFLDQWKLEREAKKLDEQRVQHTVTWTDPRTGLRVRCVGVEYLDYPTVEWTLYF